MDPLDIIIIVIVYFVIYKYYISQNKKSNENEEHEEHEEPSDKKIYDNLREKFSVNLGPTQKNEDIYDSSAKYIDAIIKSQNKNNTETNPYFMESQFHNDYRDTQNAITVLIPNQKQLFNKSDLPIINVTTPTNKEIFPLIESFIKEMNRVIKNNVTDAYSVRDWKSNLADKPFESGWEKQQEKLGLPKSIYNNPVQKEPIHLIKVDHSERFETEDEIRYVVFLVVQKKSVKDQMLIKVSFQINKQDINLDREFFEKGKYKAESLIRIEEVFIMGFLTKHSFGKHSVKSEYYDFGGITDGRMFSQKQIMNEINKKRKTYEQECVRN
jgi:hypothetical protein